jgi:hypothetical protein
MGTLQRSFSNFAMKIYQRAGQHHVELVECTSYIASQNEHQVNWHLIERGSICILDKLVLLCEGNHMDDCVRTWNNEGSC